MLRLLRIAQRIESAGEVNVIFFPCVIGGRFGVLGGQCRIGAEHEQQRNQRRIAGGRGAVKRAKLFLMVAVLMALTAINSGLSAHGCRLFFKTHSPQ